MVLENQQRELLNTFITGDCMDILPQLPPESVDLHFWDIPYNISCKTKIFRDYRQANGTKKSANISFNFDEKSEKQWDHDFDPIPILDASIASLHSTGSWIIWCSEQQYGTLRQWGLDRGFHPRQMIIWVKSNPLPQFRLTGYRQATEIAIQISKEPEKITHLMIWIAKGPIGRKNPNFIFTHQNEMTNVIYAPIVSGKEKTGHPTQKPLSVCQKIIKTHCKTGGTVFDGFSGSGTSAEAAYSLRRNFIAVEQQDCWNKIAQQRIRDYQIKVEQETDKFEQVKMF